MGKHKTFINVPRHPLTKAEHAALHGLPYIPTKQKGKLIVCFICKKAGSTLVKAGDNYKHEVCHG